MLLAENAVLRAKQNGPKVVDLASRTKAKTPGMDF
jgi:hypothetical protein